MANIESSIRLITLRNRVPHFYFAPRTTYPIQQEGEIGVPFVATSCGCLGVRKAITSANRKKC